MADIKNNIASYIVLPILLLVGAGIVSGYISPNITFWDLVKPEFNLVTIIGGILVLIPILSMLFFPLSTLLRLIEKALNTLIPGEQTMTGWLNAVMVIVGLVLIFGFSAFRNFFEFIIKDPVWLAGTIAVIVLSIFAYTQFKGDGKSSNGGKIKL